MQQLLALLNGTMPLAGTVGTADFCGPYRYRLTRCWSLGPTLLVILLNPSKAGAATDDPTVRRCIRFAQRWGYGTFVLVNVFAWCATEPGELLLARDPVGPQNDRFILKAMQEADRIVVGWGSNVDRFKKRMREMQTLLAGRELFCFAKSKKGHPKHPLYEKYTSAPEPWEWSPCFP